MLVSHRHKFIYLKTVKTGGTSVESYFERFCMPDNEWTFSHQREEYISETGVIGRRGGVPIPENCIWWNHMSAKLTKKGVGKEIWDNYFKFCVIRNPYDKAVSAYYFFRADPGERLNKDMPTDFENLDREQQKFENWLLANELPIDRDKYLIDGKFCLDDVVRYESLAEDIARVCVRLGIPWEPVFLPNLKAGFRPKNATSMNIYTEKSMEIVRAAFAFEIDYFGYSFPA